MDKNNQHINESFNELAKVFSGELESNDLKNTDNYKACANTWEILDEMKNIEEFDTDSAWNKLHNKLETNNLIKANKTKVYSLKKFVSIAASIIILFGVGITMKELAFNSNQTIENTTASLLQIDLPDGSHVSLNKDASIEYPKEFNEDTREVKLSGEAFFDVKRNTKQPFVIMVNNAQIKVLGTSFNVNSNDNNNLVVTVKSGKVQLCDCAASGNNVILEKGERGILNMNGLSKTINHEVNYLAWMDKKLSFKSTPLIDVVNDINKSYYSNISINDDIKDMLITTTFDSLTIDEVIESLVLTLDLEVKKNEKSIILVKP